MGHSHRESMRLDGAHEQAISLPLPHDELVQLHCFASLARVFADPLPGNACVRGWLDKNMIWLAPHDSRPGRPAAFSAAAIQFCLTIKVLVNGVLHTINAFYDPRRRHSALSRKSPVVIERKGA